MGKYMENSEESIQVDIRALGLNPVQAGLF